MEILKKATHVVNRLVEHGHTAYFAGGWVRDHVMGHDSNDIDIATSATPEEILTLFSKTILVGLNFGVVVVVIEGHQFEVATFRRDVEYTDGRKPESIEFCDPREDAYRRDFTINGLFYDPNKHKIYDYVEGVKDINLGIIRTIGNPHERFIEDRLRMVRAFRFASRFSFHIDIQTQNAIRENANTLFPSVSKERIWQEFCKMANSPQIDTAFIDMHRLEILPEIFPSLKTVHLNDIKHRVLHFQHFPKKCPAQLYLTQLFPDATLEEMLERLNTLRTSRQDAKILETYFHAKKLVEKERKDRLHYDPLEWVHFLAGKHAETSLEVSITDLPDDERKQLRQLHLSRQEKLKPHVIRASSKKLLVNGKQLMEIGIRPGEKMGDLIDEAERIAVDQDLDTTESVMKHLKETALWKELAP
jgi:poly(A) polymerase